MGRDGDCGDNIMPDNEDNKPLSVSDCRSQYQNIQAELLTNLLPSSHPSGSWGRESEQTQECQGVSLSCSDWLLAVKERCDWSMMGAWSLVTTQEMNDGPRSLR